MKTAKGRQVELKEHKPCDFCEILTPNIVRNAEYDGPTIIKRHANMCEAHYQEFGIDGSTITSILYVEGETELGDIEGMRKGLIAE